MPKTSSKTSRRLGVGVAALLTLGGFPLVVGAAHADEAFEFRRIAGESRFHTAALVREEFGPSSHLILANGEQGVFADALVASYLAGETESPILLTRSGKLPAPTAAAIEASGAERITIVGGTSVVGAGQEAALVAAGYVVDRIAGGNRFATNAAILDAVGNAASTTAIVTTGVDFPDALAASAVSYQTGMPLAITGSRGTNDLVIDALQAAGVQDFVVLGGDAAVSEAAVADLQNAGLSMVARLAGTDRARTSVLLADYAVSELGFSNEGVNVASGYVRGSGADALAGGPLTGQQNRPLLITRSKGTPGDTVLGYLGRHAGTLKEGIVFGGEGAVEPGSAGQMLTAARTVSQPPPGGGGGGGGGEPPPPPPPPPPPSGSAPATIVVTTGSDGHQRLDLGESHDVTANVRDSAGSPVAGANVTFGVTIDQNATGGSGMLPASQDVLTDSAGNATFSYTLPEAAGGHGCYPKPPPDVACTSQRIDTIQVSTDNGVSASMTKSWWGNGVENQLSGRIDEAVSAAEGRAESGDTLQVFGSAGVGGFVLDGTSAAGKVQDLTIDGTYSDPVLGTIRLGRDANPEHQTNPTTNSQRVEGVTVRKFELHVDEQVTGVDSGFLIVDATRFTLTQNTVDPGQTYSDEDGVRTVVETGTPSDVPGQSGTGQGTITGNTFSGLLRGVHLADGAEYAVTGNHFKNNTYHVTDVRDDSRLAAMLPEANTFEPAEVEVKEDAGAWHIRSIDSTPPPDPGGEPGLNLTPGAVDLRSGETHSVTATLLDDASQPIVGTPVTFTVVTTAGAPPGPETVTTDAAGKAVFDYSVPDGTADRSDTITATADGVTDTATAKWFDNGVQNMRTLKIFPGVQGAENRAQNEDTLAVFGNAAAKGFFVDSGENLDAQGNCHDPVVDVTIDGSAADDVAGSIRLGHPAENACDRVMNTSIGVTISNFDLIVPVGKPGFEVVNATGFHLVGNTVTGAGGGIGVANWARSVGAKADGQITGGNSFQNLDTGILFNAAGSAAADFTVSGNTFSGNTYHATDLTRDALDRMLPVNTFVPATAAVVEENGAWHIK